ncbi:MAG: trehalose-phosphatase [Candidatus Omnitrophica bacterium CG11_big_fil_rev_8_21_14_0_20_45_26]|uniref:Trehalose 6-phosphate phosphatase n=1 Tax=Candidatus Abzuiibacterium crystallinum TaxID=1974748 RepID=A0A2H0LRF3_9BACT|nr:MAG: trehalose-phosphatase [Candidatus Omnitrophica bacterium CG11_big_fil_rev_8_21_14_0_20_45_26]PIW65573.1 MAG: trehalose-phosphatase [Candidatus Omnitrophica bacterium CG12_big_fil_rev_8_21_14_0_65_45_16]
MMKRLKHEWQTLSKRLQTVNLALFLDYDGTLTPIVRHPRLAKLSNQHRQILRRLNRCPHIWMAIVSGRELKEVKRFVRIPSMTYAGNHGFQVSGPGLHLVHPQAKKSARLFQKLLPALRAELKTISGLWVENKQLTLSIHYRQVRARDVARAKQTLQKILKPFLRQRRLKMTEGKKVWELRPPVTWHKGEAVKWLLRQKQSKSKRPWLPIFIGDDVTDEDAFKAVKGHGIGVKVVYNLKRKPVRSQASYGVASVREVFWFLQVLQQLRG